MENMASKINVTTEFYQRSPEHPGSQALLIPPGRALLFTQGMTARGADSQRVAPYDVEGQTRRIIQQIEALVVEAGGTLDDVVYMTVFITKMDDATKIAKVRDEFWDPANMPPVSTTVEISSLVSDDCMVEIHAICALSS
jgi:2-iminobutanoate/2-iminopropanoate deaminase